MLSHRDIARALLIESYSDLKAAKVLLDAGVYARCIAHCQHTVEKALKAALAVRHVIVTDRHEVSDDFRQTYSDWGHCEEIGEIATEMEEEGFRTEYPLFGRRDLPIWIPSERYLEKDARDALQKAEHVFKIVMEYLANEYGITIGEAWRPRS